eukprot:14758537-Ditylum_brightwellii.AAC.1
MNVENHATCVVAYDCIWMRGTIVQQVCDCFGRVKRCMRLLNGNAIDGGQHSWINCPCVVEERAKDLLDAFDAVLRQL